MTVLFSKYLRVVKPSNLDLHPLTRILSKQFFASIYLNCAIFQHNKSALVWAKERGREEISALLGS